MRIVVFGATGSVGREVVTQVLAQGHAVTAFTRNAASVQQQLEDLRTVEGDVTDLGAVARAVEGEDAVLVSIGAARKGGVRAEGTRNVIRAMEDHGVRRLICQSTLGVGDSRANLNFLWKYVMFGLLLRPAYADHVLQESYVAQSRLDWTIVRPAAFTDGPRTGRYLHGFSSHDKRPMLKISRADVADFMLRQLTDDSYLHMAPGLSY